MTDCFAFSGGFIRIFWYINGFAEDDGNLKAIPGSHLLRSDSAGGDESAEGAGQILSPFSRGSLSVEDFEALEAGPIEGRVHPITGGPLAIERLVCPPGTVIVMWTHAAHAVQPKPMGTDTRYTLITGYRQPQCRDSISTPLHRPAFHEFLTDCL